MARRRVAKAPITWDEALTELMTSVESAGGTAEEAICCEDKCELYNSFSEADQAYECDNCGTFYKSETESHQCADCGKFGRKDEDPCCISCQEIVEWHIVAELDGEQYNIGDWDSGKRRWTVADDLEEIEEELKSESKNEKTDTCSNCGEEIVTVEYSTGSRQVCENEECAMCPSYAEPDKE